MISFIASPGSSSSIGIGSSLIDAQHGHRNAKSLSELSRRRSKYGTTRKRAPVQRRLQQIVAQNLNCSPSRPSKLAVLVSGGGRSLDNICERLEAGTLSGCEVSVVIASAATAGAIQRAEKYAIPTRVVSMKAFERQTQPFSDAVTRVLDEFGVDLVVLAGWMHFYCIPPRYYGKVINIHPSLIPAFCGKGYYGQRVHEAVIEFGAKITGCTVHLADNKYDHGPIILQRAVPVLHTDSPHDLAARVFEQEREALPQAIQLYVDGRLSLNGRIVHVSPAETA